MKSDLSSSVMAAILLCSAAASDAEKLWDASSRTIGDEAGERTMDLITQDLEDLENLEDGDTPPPAVEEAWVAGTPHPRYPNVVSSVRRNEWQPRSGYVWADPSNRNDWTVLREGEDRSIYQPAPYVSGDIPNIAWSVVYRGRDGVNVRAEPGGTSILATAYHQNVATIRGLSAKPVYKNGIPWVKVELHGWMAKRKLGKSYSYLAELGDGNAIVTWNGRGDPDDNFIALKAGPNIQAKRIAKVYTHTSISTGESQVSGSFEWVRARFVGWMATENRKGTRLLSVASP